MAADVTNIVLVAQAVLHAGGSLRRHGRLELSLVLPDGSKSLVPETWTDPEGGIEVTDEAPATLRSLEDLLAAAGFRSFRLGSAGT